MASLDKFLQIESINKHLKWENDKNKEVMSQIVKQKETSRDKQLGMISPFM